MGFKAGSKENLKKNEESRENIWWLLKRAIHLPR
jgi:hypothetical protein